MNELKNCANALLPPTLDDIVKNTKQILAEGYYNINMQKNCAQSFIFRHRTSLVTLLREIEFGIIGELKIASPTMQGSLKINQKSLIERIQLYINSGVIGLSIITEPDFFCGSLDYLRLIASTYPKIPILMKDFIIDTQQIEAARLVGASAILLIAKICPKETILQLIDFAHNKGLEVLLEVNNLQEMEFALSTEADIIGINNRDLTTFQVDLSKTETIMRLISKQLADNMLNRPVIALSGIKDSEDAKRMKQTGVNGVLVGTALTKLPDPSKLIKSLAGV